MSNLTFYTNPQSRGRVVRWMLEETEAPYDVRVMEYGGNMKSPEYLKINSMGKVPALVHGDTVVTEVAAICTYLADQFPDKGLAPPAGSPDRGSFYRWLFFVAGPLEIAMNARAYQWRIDDDNVGAVGCGRVEDTLGTLEQTLSSAPYLCGGRFTTADLLLASYLNFGISIFKTFEPRPVFVEYTERCGDREAARRAAALDDALLPKEAS